MVVTLHSSVHDSSITLLPDTFLGDLVVDPVRVAPHAAIDLAKLDWGTGIVLHRVHELLVEVTIVEEHVWIVPPAVEVSLDGLDRLDNTIDLLVSGQNHEGGICPWATRVDILASGGKDLVMFLADFSVGSVNAG